MSTKNSGSSRGGRNKSKQKTRGQVQGNSKPKDPVQKNPPTNGSERIDGSGRQQRKSTDHSTDTSNNDLAINPSEGRPINTGPKTATRRKFMREQSTSADNPRSKVQEHTMPALQFDGAPIEAEEGPLSSGLGRKGVRKNELVSFYELESTKNSKDSWRRLPEVPSVEELLRERVDLPINIVDAPYDSVDDYLEAHYELLREDAFAGLREAVGYIRQDPKAEDTQETAIYDHVRLLGLTFAPIGVCCKVSFSLNRAGKKISWENSKRLIPGTLVCLSDDEFQTLRVATVAARPMAGLSLDPPEVDLLFNDSSEIEIDSSKTFLMVESRQGYFEAYKWTLKALQRINESNFQLADHLCFLTKNVPPPDYLREKPTLNLSTIFPDSNDKEALEEVNVLKPWPEKINTTMDKSQLSAFKTILTNRVAIVQGPPGTGKTWVSVLALRAILKNMDKGDPPIVVACQTNHALDQLLNKILDYESDVVRLGGRTQDREKILERTIFELASNSKVQILGSQLSRSRMLKEVLISKMVELLKTLSQELLTPEDLSAYGVISQDQEQSFFSSREGWVTFKDDEQNSGVMADWLGDYFVPVLVPGNLYEEYEEGEIEYERIKEIEAEFQSGGANNDFDDSLRGSWLPMSRQFYVRQPIGVSDDDLRQALKASNVWDLGEHLRAAMYHHLKAKVLEKIRRSLGGMMREYQGHVTQMKIARLEKYAHIAGSCKLVGLTTTGLSKYRSLLAALKPKVLLIEEAAETLEGLVTAGCMPSVEHLILVGDHKQLRGHCSVRELAGDPFFLEISMFERLVSNKLPYVTLRTQRRMRPEIREILRPIYHDMLKDHKTVLGRPGVPGMGNNHVYWYSHTNPERRDEGTSRINVEEAAMIVGFVEYLILNKNSPEKITILTFYGGQKSEILKGVRRNINLKQTNVKVVTVDSYQGEENDIIILSLVRSNENGSVGFLNVANRVCVALSRAKLGFYIFGNAQMITKADKIWWEVGKILNLAPTRIGFSMPIVCQKHGKSERIKESHDWIDVAGGCYQWCKETLPCKHTCHFRCHPFDHSEIRCIEKCTRRLSCNHPCLEDCYETCICRKCANRVSSGESLKITSPGIDSLQNDMESFTNDTGGPVRDTRTELMARGVGFNNYDQRGRAGFTRGNAKDQWGDGVEHGGSQDSRLNTKKTRGMESSSPFTPRGNPTPRQAVEALTDHRGPQDMRLGGGIGRNPSSNATGRGRGANVSSSQPTTTMSWSAVAGIGQQPSQGSQGRLGGPNGPGGGYTRR